MSFTRSMYDKCALIQRNTESNGPFSIITDKSVKESTKSCYLRQSPFSHSPHNSIPSGIVDLESQLRVQDRHLSRCDTTKYTPKPKCEDCSKCDKSLPCDCLHCLTSKEHTNGIECEDTGLIPTYSRLNKSCNVLAGVNINRFEQLCENPQLDSKIHTNDIIGQNSRLAMRDSYNAGEGRDPRLSRTRGV